MSAYIVGRIAVREATRYPDYTAQTPALIAKHGGRFIVRGGTTSTLEGPEEARRVVVIDLSEKRNEPLCLINPEILEKHGEEQMEEGCLSVPGIYDTVTRAEGITVQALDRDGEPFQLQADGLLAVCIQHEIDHLDGRLFVDYLSSLKRQRIRKKLEKTRREGGGQPAAPARRAI